jgi:hypothetical protein
VGKIKSALILLMHGTNVKITNLAVYSFFENFSSASNFYFKWLRIVYARLNNVQK